MRVVALLPAATEIVCAVGGGDCLAGISHECRFPPEVAGLPRVTSSAVDAAASEERIDAQVRTRVATGASLFAIDEALLRLLEPDLIITQAVCEVCAIDERDVRAVAARIEPVPDVVTLGATTLEGVFEDIGRVGRAIDRAETAERVVAALHRRLRVVHEVLRNARAPRPRVAVIEWTDPPFVAGHWVPDMVRRAGGVDVAGVAGAHSRPVDAAALHDADPEIVLVAPCGFALDRAVESARSLLRRPGWEWARARTVWALDGDAFTSRPGPRLIDGVEIVAHVLHPTLFPAPPDGAVRRLS
jgi:iron complex transport system substrate-binding protein